MLKLGSHLSFAGGVDTAIDRAAPLGLRSLQVFTKNANQWAAKPLEPAVVERYREKLQQSELEIVVAHDSYLINIASPDDEMWEKSIQALKVELDRCDLLGIPYLVSHPGAHMQSGVDAGVARVTAAVNRIHADMPDGGCSIAIETTAGQGTTLGRTFAEIAQMVDGIEDKSRVVVCMDTCHIFVAGYDILSESAYNQTIQQFDDVVGLEYLKVLHLNDSLKGLGSHRDRHAHLGEGELGAVPFGFFLNDRRLDGLPGILETPKKNDFEDDHRNLTLLRSMVN